MIQYEVNGAQIALDPTFLHEIKRQQIRGAKGCYGWYILRSQLPSSTDRVAQSERVYLYVGTVTDAPMTSVTSRFLAELSGAQVTTDKGRSFDTDFVVSSALAFFTQRGINITFEILSEVNGRQEEIKIARERRPILQRVTDKSVQLLPELKRKIGHDPADSFEAITIQLQRLLDNATAG